MKTFLVIVGLIGISASATAASNETLSMYFTDTIAQADSIMQDPTFAQALAQAQLQDFNPEFTAQATFGLSDVVQITISPQLDLVYTPESADAN